MNIFILDKDPIKAAEYHNDKHVIKMILESAQIMCSVMHSMGYTPPYKATHKNHPCVLWAKQSRDNYLWLAQLAKSLCHEYEYRYDKLHKSKPIIEWCTEYMPVFQNRGLTPFFQAMPDDCRMDDAIQAYRKYYWVHKWRLASWTNRGAPHWWLDIEKDPITNLF